MVTAEEQEVIDRHRALQKLHARGEKCSRCCGEPGHAGCKKCATKTEDAK